jgi:hypothetical protein
MATLKSAVRPIERLTAYASVIHVGAIAADRFVAVVYPLHYETRMTPATLRCVVAAVWLVAAGVSLPAYVGFATSLVPPQSCIVTLWPIFESVVEVVIYSANASFVVFVYARIWSTAMRHEARLQQQQLQVNYAKCVWRVVMSVTMKVRGQKQGVCAIDVVAVTNRPIS